MLKKAMIVATIIPLGSGAGVSGAKTKKKGRMTTTHFWSGKETAPNGFMETASLRNTREHDGTGAAHSSCVKTCKTGLWAAISYGVGSVQNKDTLCQDCCGFDGPHCAEQILSQLSACQDYSENYAPVVKKANLVEEEKLPAFKKE
ncbi:unnamed protein product [Amoebophrya sp. A120]|nr:unnamed protein product [Amoebophrya sp. A120]|eukprot:GSA120T00024651001.1